MVAVVQGGRHPYNLLERGKVWAEFWDWLRDPKSFVSATATTPRSACPKHLRLECDVVVERDPLQGVRAAGGGDVRRRVRGFASSERIAAGRSTAAERADSRWACPTASCCWTPTTWSSGGTRSFVSGAAVATWSGLSFFAALGNPEILGSRLLSLPHGAGHGPGRAVPRCAVGENKFYEVHAAPVQSNWIRPR